MQLIMDYLCQPKCHITKIIAANIDHVIRLKTTDSFRHCFIDLTFPSVLKSVALMKNATETIQAKPRRMNFDSMMIKFKLV